MKHISEILEEMGATWEDETGQGYRLARDDDGRITPVEVDGGCGDGCSVMDPDDPGLPLGWESVEIVEP